MSSLSSNEIREPLIYSSTSKDEYELQITGTQPTTFIPRKRQKLLSGWRVGAIASAVTTTLVLIVNITLTTVYLLRFGLRGGNAVILEGDCDAVKSLDRWTHFGINAASTVLLCCSNYCMQSISAPTRAELLKAHNHKTWLHIGIQSFRNLRHIHFERAILWLLLLFSSAPLHLLYVPSWPAKIQKTC
jgi:hypothetical protein